jgi:hypothetical protein
MNQGAELLAGERLSVRQIAERLKMKGASQVHRWLKGQEKPNDARRKQIQAEWPRVHTAAWDEAPSAPAADRDPKPANVQEQPPAAVQEQPAAVQEQPAAVQERPAAAAGDGWDGHITDPEPAAADPARPWLRPRPARAELELQVKRLGDLVKDPGIVFGERVKLEPLLRQAVAQLAQVTGEARPSDVERLLMSKDFERVMGVIGRVLLARCPDAYAEIVAAVRALDEAAAAADEPGRAA